MGKISALSVLSSRVIKTLLSPIVQDNIYPLVADEDVTGDYIVYRRTGYNMSDNKQRYSAGYADFDFSIMIVSPEYGRSLELLDEVMDVIIDYQGIIDEVNIADIQLIDSSESWSDSDCIQELDIRVITKK